MDTQCCYEVRIMFGLVVMITGALAEIEVPWKHEMLFANPTTIVGEKVTCENVRPTPAKFPADTWVCNNMKVSGHHVRYWYIPGFGADTGCSDGKSKYDSRNDLAQICRHMMAAHGIDKELWTVYVNKASCSRSPGQRAIFALKNDTFKWELVDEGNGYIITFRCMVVD